MPVRETALTIEPVTPRWRSWLSKNQDTCRAGETSNPAPLATSPQPPRVRVHLGVGAQRTHRRERVLGQKLVRPLAQSGLRVPLGPLVVDEGDYALSSERLGVSASKLPRSGSGAVYQRHRRTEGA